MNFLILDYLTGFVPVAIIFFLMYLACTFNCRQITRPANELDRAVIYASDSTEVQLKKLSEGVAYYFVDVPIEDWDIGTILSSNTQYDDVSIYNGKYCGMSLLGVVTEYITNMNRSMTVG